MTVCWSHHGKDQPCEMLGYHIGAYEADDCGVTASCIPVAIAELVHLAVR
jgi:hypothetical protein